MKKVKVKPNLRKMFNFHTIILVILVIVVSKLHTHTSEAKLQRLQHKIHHHHHHHHQHNRNYKQVNVNGFAEANDEADKQKQQHNHPPHHHHNPSGQHQHSHHLKHHQRHYNGATAPSFEFTTSSSSSSTSFSSSSSSSSSFNSSAIASDNEFLIKQQERHRLSNQDDDETQVETKDLQSFAGSSTSSTTSNPSLSIHAAKASNASLYSLDKETLASFSVRAHTHHSHNNSIRLISTPLTTPEGNNSGSLDNNRTTGNFATMFAKGPEHTDSNWNSIKDDNKAKDEETSIPLQQSQSRTHKEQKPEFSYEEQQQQQQQQLRQHSQRPQQNYEDYYADAEDDDADVDVDVDVDDDDDYVEDEGDNDGNSYDDDKNLSDRSYARITRSKLDDDYIDDEPYRNGIDELSMQRDAAPGVLTEQKYLDVGNEKAVQQARERYIQEQKRPRTPHELATEHWHRMIQATKCRKPLPRVIPISNNTSKRYEPYATILHRCGDDTGCCGSTASVCTVKRHEIVMVYVFSYDFNYRKEIEALPMQNHTECHCVNRGSLLHDSMPRDKRSGGSGSSYLYHFQRQQRKLQLRNQPQQLESQPYSQLQAHHQQQSQNTLDCHCPRHFNVFEEDVERRVHLPKPHSVFIRKCRCDCMVNNQTCLRFKHGEEGFSLEDRKCVLERDCKPPVCLYGDYNLRLGRCPSYRSHLSQTT